MIRRAMKCAAAGLLCLAIGVGRAPAQGLVPASTATKLTLDNLIALGHADLDDFWARAFRTGYRAPGGLYPYESPVDTPCGPATLGNAFYCGADHNVYYDAGLVRSVFGTARFADFGALTVFAHEWGHAAQAQMGPGLTSPLRKARELQADCFAGSYAKFLDAKGSSRLVLEPGDLEEGATILFALGDSLPWFDRQAHGTPDERSLYFTIGLNEGLDACYPDEVYKDGAFFIVRPRPWRAQADGKWIDRATYVETVLLSPPGAERAELHGYLSEGIRITIQMPARGLTWNSLQQSGVTNGLVARVIQSNPGFRLMDSTAGVWAALPGRTYRFVGTDPRIHGSERTSYVAVSDHRLTMLVELTSPASRYDYYQRRLERLFATLHFLRPEAPTQTSR